MSEKEEPLQGTPLKDEEAHAWVVRLSSDQRTRQDEQRLGAEVNPFCAKNSCSEAEKTKSIPQSAQVST